MLASLTLVVTLGSPVPLEPALALVAAARQQVGVTVHYDPSYHRLAYPGGDVPLERGVCTDVLVRAYRALGADLQRLVHEDMLSARSAYPHVWAQANPDSNIDHRRVPNLAVFFARHGQVLPVSADPLSYRPGDVVTWRLPSGVPHIGLVSDRTSPQGVPLVIHNIGLGAQEEDALFAYTLTRHLRYLPSGATDR